MSQFTKKIEADPNKSDAQLSLVKSASTESTSASEATSPQHKAERRSLPAQKPVGQDLSPAKVQRSPGKLKAVEYKYSV